MSSESITSQICEQFTRNIREGIWQVDQKIPTEMELMRHFNVGRNTIRAALQQLEKKEWIKAVPGVGRSITAKAMTTRGLIGMLIRGGELGVGQGGRFHAQAKEHAKKLGYQFTTFHIDFERSHLASDPDESPLPVSLDAIDCAIVYSRHYMPADILSLAGKMPVATAMTHNITSPNVLSFHIDYTAHAAKAVQYVLEQGIDNYTFIQHQSVITTPFTMEMANSYKLASYLAGESQCRPRTLTWKSNITRPEDFYEQWASNPNRPKAIICHLSEPLHALALQLAAHDVPVDDYPLMICLADLSDIPLSHIAYFDIDIEKMACDCVESLHTSLIAQNQPWIHETYLGQLNLSRIP